jgi:CHAD domain-containing protein
MKPCGPDVSMESFARAQTAELVAVAAAAVQRAAVSPGEEAVHKMRVSIRRVQQALRLFRQFLRKGGVKSIRRELKAIMEPAGELRNCHIALGLLRRAGQDAPEIRARKVAARQNLCEILATTARDDLSDRWLRELGIESHEAVET